MILLLLLLIFLITILSQYFFKKDKVFYIAKTMGNIMVLYKILYYEESYSPQDELCFI